MENEKESQSRNAHDYRFNTRPATGSQRRRAFAEFLPETDHNRTERGDKQPNDRFP